MFIVAAAIFVRCAAIISALQPGVRRCEDTTKRVIAIDTSYKIMMYWFMKFSPWLTDQSDMLSLAQTRLIKTAKQRGCFTQ